MMNSSTMKNGWPVLAIRYIGMPNAIASRQPTRYTRRRPTRSVSLPAYSVVPTAMMLAMTTPVSPMMRSSSLRLVI